MRQPHLCSHQWWHKLSSVAGETHGNHCCGLEKQLFFFKVGCFSAIWSEALVQGNCMIASPNPENVSSFQNVAGIAALSWCRASEHQALTCTCLCSAHLEKGQPLHCIPAAKLRWRFVITNSWLSLRHLQACFHSSQVLVKHTFRCCLSTL